MQAQVIIFGAARGVEQLTYAIPTHLGGQIAPGQRVLVELRSRKVSAIVSAVGEQLSDASLKPILEVMDERPLLDAAHLRLMEFLASYYMAALGDAYRSVIPSAARVESRLVWRLAHAPDRLRRAAMSAVESRLIEMVARRPAAARSLGKLGPPAEARAALSRLVADGIVERYDSTRGRHRDSAELTARILAAGAPAPIRGARQRELLGMIAEAGAGGIRLEELRKRIPAAGAIAKSLARRGLVELAPGGTFTRGDGAGAMLESPLELTLEQQAACEAIAPALEQSRFETFLLWGVTASGKTEVYLALAARVLAAGRNVLVLVPEIALADELVRAFRARFGAMVGIAHSAQTVSERWASWMAALGGEARIMIGPRSVIFAPLHDLGLIVVDEEHDPAFKSEEGIRYHARDLAVALGGFAACPVVLGSATPSAESFANARRGRYRLLRLLRRVNDRAMAEVEIVDLRREMAALRESAARHATAPGANGTARVSKPAGGHDDSVPDPIPLSTALLESLRKNLADRGQSIVFLNRRGFHNFLQCSICGSVITCANCSVSMTYHLRDRSLRCHYCASRVAAPDACPECKGFGLMGQGFGTERLTETLARLMPEARIERMDSDTSGRRGARAQIVAGLRAGEIDIVVGTQMITKGFDFPGVTLVAVVLADLALNLPDFRSAERTFQLLTQVAGRAGRGERPGRVIIQTYAPNHYSIRAARDQDYARFMRRELELRRELDYPPFARLAMVRIEGPEPRGTAAIANAAAAALSRSAPPEQLRVLGPAPAPIERIKRRYRWQVMVKSRELRAMRAALASMRTEVAPRAEREKVHVIIDIDPVRML
jgi:primosomal protein N' (replication factor Y) (superfamily II helicase)